MSRIFDWGIGSLFGQDDGEGRALVWTSGKLHQTAVLLNDTGSNREAQTGAAFLRRKERIEKTLLDVRFDAPAGIDDVEHDGGFATAREGGRTAVGAKGDGAAGGHAVRAVLREVDEDLLELLGIGGEVEVIGGFDGDFDIAASEFRFEEALNFLEEVG